MTGCRWMWIKGCLRCIDGVSPNVHRDDCRAGNVPVATVDQLMGTDFTQPLIYVPHGPAGGPIGDQYVLPDIGWLNGLGALPYYDAYTGEWFGGDQAPVVGPIALAPEKLVEIALVAESVSTGSLVVTLPPLPPIVSVPEPGSALILAAALLLLTPLQARGKGRMTYAQRRGVYRASDVVGVAVLGVGLAGLLAICLAAVLWG